MVRLALIVLLLLCGSLLLNGQQEIRTPPHSPLPFDVASVKRSTGRSLGSGTLQAAAAQPNDGLAFEVASIKRSLSNERGARVAVQPSGRVVLTNIPISAFILGAYGLQDMFQIEGAPEWTNAERYDIVAQVPEGISVTSAFATGTEVTPLQRMQQSLLIERFNFVGHIEQREVPVYALVRKRPNGALGPNLTPSNTDCVAWRAAQARAGTPPPPATARRPCGMSGTVGLFSAGAIPLSQFAALVLAPRLGRPVVDRTGLTGNYDVFVTFRPDDPPPGATLLSSSDPNAPTLLTALEEQLGLKIESTKARADVLVIEHIDRPTPN